MPEPREFKYSVDISVWAESEEDAAEKFDDGFAFGQDIELTECAPYSSNPTSVECTNCCDFIWEDEVESCSECGAELCGNCLVKLNGVCQYCAEDTE